MAKVSAYIQALKDHGRARPTDAAEIPAMLNDLMSESDRSAIILISTTVEDAIESELIRRMPGVADETAPYSLIFGSDGPVSTFSNKIKMGLAMGILSPDVRRQVDIVREIRNACAHARYPTSFETPAIIEACKHLLADMRVASEKEPTLRDYFIMKCMLITQYVVDGKWRTTSDDILDLLGDELPPSPETRPQQ
ncbi:hypothetical protein QO010_000762 [Caulobacter ginsengisoli]|uniref:Transcriptional regulator n=1 Tax=Caulobacter ginsengisoli TaxID=400775 RepID=A0ABU0ILY1_9CAUL|nr:hypothetical protein [Caulobacter ginsengisoli]MDQ0463014.1 hypothetical protein [Caulobacter ginsengisoli]